MIHPENPFAPRPMTRESIVPSGCCRCLAPLPRVLVHLTPDDAIWVCDGPCVAGLGAAGPDFVALRAARPTGAIECWSWAFFDWWQGVRP